MKQRIIFLLKYYALWLLFFILIRFIFIWYQFNQTKEFEFGDIFLAFVHGFRLDLSFSGYFMLLVGLILTLTSFFKGSIAKKILFPITILLVIICSLFSFVDFELYRNWGFHLDSTPLLYINTPKEMLASTNYTIVIPLILACILFMFFIIRLFKKKIFIVLDKTNKGNIFTALVLLFVTSLMILPVRGGVGIAPINVGTVYFHKESYPNHVAVNTMWNLTYSIKKMKRLNQDYNFLKIDKAKSIVSSITQNNKKSNQKVIKNNRPNVLFIILESFTGKAVECVGGEANVTPNLNKLSKEGILFTNFYANADRSDKGLVAILSAYPAQPTISIMKFPQKTQSLEFIPKVLRQNGYHTAYYYGGEINFANMNSYVTNARYEDVVTMASFDEKFYNSKWGVHDSYMFDKLFKDIQATKEPFFKTFFTLSSHEPFDVPMKTVIKGSDEDAKFKNSLYYTDKCLGEFIEKAKKEDWWNNTLIVLVADHGSRLPNNSPTTDLKKYKIPMLWIGGALTKTDTIISKPASQIDIAKTLLNQMDINADKFIFSKDLLNKDNKSFGFFVYNNGFGYIDDNLLQIHDNIGKKYIKNIGSKEEQESNKGRAVLQVFYNDFLRK